MSPTLNEREDLARSNQEQAVAAWVNYLNQIRLDSLLDSLSQRDMSLGEALSSVDDALEAIRRDIVGLGRGNERTTHGFIAEVAEVGVGNAREQILGKATPYQWVNNNGPVDLVRDGVDIQQKFVLSDRRFGLGAIAEHLRKYPDYVRDGGKYQIPADQFETIEYLYRMPKEDAGKLLSRASGGPSPTDWERVQEFFDEGSVPFESIEPSKLEYAQVQLGTYESTLEAEKDSLRETDQRARDEAYQESRPTLGEGVQATATAAAIEGGTSFVFAVIAKRREGKKLKDFSLEDWQQVAGETAFGAAKGGVRGFSIYTLTNFTATPAFVASAIVTAGFGIAEQANSLRRGEIGEREFLENAEVVALEAAVSALSSLVGQALIPVPVVGAVIGNTVGTIMYRIASSSLSKREAELIQQYLDEQRALDESLAARYQNLIDELAVSTATYVEILDRAFSPNVQIALDGSVELALKLGVPVDEVLDTPEKAHAYFVN